MRDNFQGCCSNAGHQADSLCSRSVKRGSSMPVERVHCNEFLKPQNISMQAGWVSLMAKLQSTSKQAKEVCRWCYFHSGDLNHASIAVNATSWYAKIPAKRSHSTAPYRDLLGGLQGLVRIFDITNKGTYDSPTGEHIL